MCGKAPPQAGDGAQVLPTSAFALSKGRKSARGTAKPRSESPVPHRVPVMVKTSLLAFVITAALAAPASAGWITITNATDKVVVIQETSVVNGRLVKGKAYKLTPGEVLKEFQTGPGEKTVLVFEKDAAGNPEKVKLSWGKDDAAFTVTTEGADLKLASRPK